MRGRLALSGTRSGLWRSVAIGIPAILVIAYLAVTRTSQVRESGQERDRAQSEAYAAAMQAMPENLRRGSVQAMRDSLASLRDNPAKGWEWAYWSRRIDPGAEIIGWNGGVAAKASSSPDGKTVAVSGPDVIDVFDVATGQTKSHISLDYSVGSSWKVWFYRDGNRLLAQNGTGTILVIIDLAKASMVRQARFRSISVAGCGTWWDMPGDPYTLATDIERKEHGVQRLFRLDLNTLEETAVPLSNSGSVRSIAFNRDGSRLAWADGAPGSETLSIRRGDFQEIRRIPVLGGEAAMAFDRRDNSMVLFDGRSLSRCDVDTGRSIWSTPLDRAVTNIDTSLDGSQLLATVGERRALLYEMGPKGPRLASTLLDSMSAWFLEGGKILSSSAVARILPAPKPTDEVRLPGGPFVQSPGSSGDRLTLLGAGKVVTLDPNQPLSAPRVLSTPLTGGLDPTGRFVFKTGEQSVIATDLESRQQVHLLPAPASSFFQAYAADHAGKLIALVRDSTTLGVYGAQSGEPVAMLGGLGVASKAEFSPDGTKIAVGDLEGNVIVWTTSDWKRIGSAALGKFAINCLAFSDDGKRVAAGQTGGNCGILDIASSKFLILQGHSEKVNSVTWSHDGMRLASGAADSTVRVWDTNTGRNLGVIGEHDAPIVGVWFVKGDRTLCSLDSDGALKLWRTSSQL